MTTQVAVPNLFASPLAEEVPEPVAVPPADAAGRRKSRITDLERIAFWTMGVAYLALFIGALSPETVIVAFAWWGFVLAFVMSVVSLPGARRRSYWLALVTLVFTAPMLPLPILIGMAQPAFHDLEANITPTSVSIIDGGLTLSSPGANWRLLDREAIAVSLPECQAAAILPAATAEQELIGFIYAHPRTDEDLKSLDLDEIGQQLFTGSGLSEKRDLAIKAGTFADAPCVACQFVGELDNAIHRVRVIVLVHRGHLIQLWFTGVDGPQFTPAAKDFYAAVALNAK